MARAEKRADQLLELAQELIMTGGYNAFSYQDLADRLGIRKASIHYHFPKKSDLGLAVIERYGATQQAMMAELDPDTPAREKFEAYLTPFMQVSGSGALVCLCGVMGGELAGLPEDMQAAVARFFGMHEQWLSGIFDEAREQDVLAVTSATSTALAKTIFSSLQGALIISRAHGDPNHFQTVADTWKALLFG